MFSFLSSYRLHAQLPAKDKLDEHVKALRTLRRDPEHQALLDHLYGSLSVLDAKSSSLLSFNSIIIAVFAIFLTEGQLSAFGRGTVIAGMAAVIVSCFLLLSVVWVHWSTTDDLGYRPEKHGEVLLGVRRSRTLLYRLAWYFSVAAMVGLSVLLCIRTVR